MKEPFRVSGEGCGRGENSRCEPKVFDVFTPIPTFPQSLEKAPSQPLGGRIEQALRAAFKKMHQSVGNLLAFSARNAAAARSALSLSRGSSLTVFSCNFISAMKRLGTP